MSVGPRVAFLFPGQGAETQGMGLAFAKHSARAAALLDLASEVAGLDLRRLLAEGGPALDRTEVLQPALTAVALGACAALEAEGIQPSALLGHSVGELAAFTVAGAMEPEAAVRVAGARGRLMAREAAEHPGGLVALIGAWSEVERVLAADARLELAVSNAPNQWIVGGPIEAVGAAARSMASVAVRVSGAWHGRSMAGAVAELREALEAIPRRPLRIPVYANLNGRRVAPDCELPSLLAEQLIKPARFAEGLRYLAADGIDTFVAVGCGRLLRALVRKSLPEAKVLLAEEPSDLSRLGEVA